MCKPDYLLCKPYTWPPYLILMCTRGLFKVYIFSAFTHTHTNSHMYLFIHSHTHIASFCKGALEAQIHKEC